MSEMTREEALCDVKWLAEAQQTIASLAHPAAPAVMDGIARDVERLDRFLIEIETQNGIEPAEEHDVK